MICGCLDYVVWGHRLDCKLRPEAQPACSWPCTTDAYWNRCSAWKAQARAFGWPVPAREAPEEALA